MPFPVGHSGDYPINIKNLPWSCAKEDLDYARRVLSLLAEHNEAALDIDKMLNKLNLQQFEGNDFYIVVTVIEAPILVLG